MFDILRKLQIGINNTARSIESMYYLYKKTHNKTGLQYLGKTTRDPNVYKGSGLRWTNHINEHGYDVTTEILRECSSNEEVKEWGVYYSKLWNVVQDYNWANLKEECGDGGDTSAFIDYTATDYDYKSNSSYKEKVSGSCKAAWHDKFNSDDFDELEFKRMCSVRTKKMWQKRGISEDDKRKRSATAKENYLNDPSLSDKVSTGTKAAWDKNPQYYMVTFPNGSVEKIKFLRRWCKDNAISYNKLYGTIRRNKPSKDGWFVKKLDV
jgi:hypothetical protein